MHDNDQPREEFDRELDEVREHTLTPWAKRALSATLPYKVYADMRTDVRTDVACRDHGRACPNATTLNDILRRTMPRTEG